MAGISIGTGVAIVGGMWAHIPLRLLGNAYRYLRTGEWDKPIEEE